MATFNQSYYLTFISKIVSPTLFNTDMRPFHCGGWVGRGCGREKGAHNKERGTGELLPTSSQLENISF